MILKEYWSREVGQRLPMRPPRHQRPIPTAGPEFPKKPANRTSGLLGRQEDTLQHGVAAENGPHVNVIRVPIMHCQIELW
jgi:hypothetical protein